MNRDDRDVRLVALWLRGIRVKAVAHEMGWTSHGPVYAQWRKLGVPTRYVKPVGDLNRNLWPMIVACIRAGRTPEEIADGIGLTGRAREIMVRGWSS